MIVTVVIGKHAVSYNFEPKLKKMNSFKHRRE